MPNLCPPSPKYIMQRKPVRLNLPDTNTYHKVTIIKLVCYSYRKRYISAKEYLTHKNLRIYVQSACNDSYKSTVVGKLWVCY